MTPQTCVKRIDTLAQKLLIRRTLGQQKADYYFECLKRWFSARITKADFDVLLTKTLGLKHIPLHNRLIKSIAYNSCIRTHRPVIVKDMPRVPEWKPAKIIPIESEPPPLEGASVEEGEEVEQARVSLSVPSKIKRPPSQCLYQVPNSICQKIGELPDTKTLMIRLNEKLQRADMKVTVDCVNLLNSAVDSYLKSIIKPGLATAGMKRKSSERFSVSMEEFKVGLEANQMSSSEGRPYICRKQNF